MKILIDRCRSHLLVIVTKWYCAGILSSRILFPPPHSFFPAYQLTCLLLFLTFIFWVFRRNRSVLLVLCLTFFFFGLARTDQIQERRSRLSELASTITENQEVDLVGILAEMVTGSQKTSRILIEVQRLRKKGEEQFSKSRDRVLLTMKDSWPSSILPGQTVIIKAILNRPPIPHTPGVFDYSAYLAGRNIFVTGVIESPLLIQQITNEADQSALPYRYYIERTRMLIARKLEHLLASDLAELYKALLIGDKSGVADATIETFKKAGVLHILAISGVHLALLGFLLFQALFWLLRRSEKLILTINVRKLASLLCIPPLLVYTFLAGSHIPVMRSFIMAIFVVFALSADRLRSPFTLLSGTALCLLIYDPLGLQSASFQLSFCAVGSIILIVPRLTGLHNHDQTVISPLSPSSRIWSWLKTCVLLTLAATFGTMPLLLYHFNYLSLVAIPANLVIEPLICLWSLPLGFIALPLLFISPGTAGILLKAGSAGLLLAKGYADFLCQLPFSGLWLPNPEIWIIIFYYLTCLVLFSPLSGRFFRLSGFLSYLISFLLLLLPATGLQKHFRHRNVVSIIDVGHGSANLIELSDGKTILIDGGARSSPDFDCGVRILAPFLWHRGVARIDDIIVTHDDSDHYNGIPAILERFQPRRLWLPYRSDKPGGYGDLCRQAENRHVQIMIPRRDMIVSSEGSLLKVIGLEKSDREGSRSGDDNGLVLRLQTNEFSILFPGDISKSKERSLVEKGKLMRTDILLSSHHGSATSNSLQFLKVIFPRLLIISTGDKTGRLFPSVETMRNAQRLNIPVITTLREGTITITGNENGYLVTDFRSNHPFQEGI